MKPTRSFRPGVEAAVLAALLVALAASSVMVVKNVSRHRRALAHQAWMEAPHKKEARPLDLQTLERTIAAAERPVQAAEAGLGLLVSELRVAAVGSAYPIPYEAEICPYSGVPQPAMNQLDRDGDGMTDDWELKYGFDKYNAADALKDSDGDGFTNLEEFRAAGDPLDPGSHPPYATKLRFVRRINVPFPIMFQGVNELPDNRFVLQINTPADGNTYFKSLGDDLGEGLREEIAPEIKESLKGIVLQEFIPGNGLENPPRLVVQRGGALVELTKGKTAIDPESQAELINVLDHSRQIVTMGALLSLRNDEYTVLGVYEDRVVLKQSGTGEVFDIVDLAKGGSEDSPEDL